MHDTYAFDRLVGGSAWTDRLRRQILRASSYSYPVLITGPQGSGKELAARAIHAHSDRHAAPFIPFRCATLPACWQMGQLFGADGAVGEPADVAARMLGCVGAANGGVLYVEEVGRLSAAAQAALLAFLKRKPGNVRVIASTTDDLRQKVADGRFCFELLYRLNAFRLEVRPLSERREDIGPLAKHLLAKLSLESGLPLPGLTAGAMAALKRYPWPGNVDELERTLEAALALVDGPWIDASMLQRWLDPANGDFARSADSSDGRAAGAGEWSQEGNDFESVVQAPTPQAWRTLAQAEAAHIRHTLRETSGDTRTAADLLDVAHATLLEKMRRLGVRATGRRPSSLGDRVE